LRFQNKEPPGVRNHVEKNTAWYTITIIAAMARIPSKHGKRAENPGGLCRAPGTEASATINRA
jgi:hypothetical protein